MSYTHDKPTKPGYYWRRCLIATVEGQEWTEPVLLEVVERFNGLWVVPLWPSEVRPWQLTAVRAIDQWAPIERPPLPSIH